MNARVPMLPAPTLASIAKIRAHLAAPKRAPRALVAPAFEGPAGALLVVVPLRTINPLNVREHFRVRAKRVTHEHLVTLAALRQFGGRVPPGLPLRITMQRVGPSAMDSDGAVAAMKGVRDQIAKWLGVDDRDSPRLVWCYGPQVRGPFAVWVMIERLETP